MSIVQRIEALEKKLDIVTELAGVLREMKEASVSVVETLQSQKRLNADNVVMAGDQNDLIGRLSMDHAFLSIMFAGLLKILQEDKIIPGDSVQAMLHAVTTDMDPKTTTFYEMFRILAAEGLSSR